MSCLFAYARVVPASKPTAAAELRKTAAAAGHVILPDNTVVETVVGSAALFSRPLWRGLLDRMYEGDVLVVPALSDLGCDVKEVCATIRHLGGTGLRAYCLELAPVDLASPAGRPTMQVLAAVADFEQGLKAERERQSMGAGRTPSPIRRKGRPSSLSLGQVAEARQLLAGGLSIVQIARRLQTSRQTIMRARENAQSRSKSTALDRQ